MELVIVIRLCLGCLQYCYVVGKGIYNELSGLFTYSTFVFAAFEIMFDCFSEVCVAWKNIK
jgi:hypothetical protein